MIVGNVLSVLLRLLISEPVGHKHIHFFFRYENCHETTWWISFVFILATIGLFTIIRIKLFKMEKKNASK